MGGWLQQPCLSYHKIGYSVLETMSINGKKTEIGVFIGSSLSFTIRTSTLGLGNDLHISKRCEKPAEHVILIWSEN